MANYKKMKRLRKKRNTPKERELRIEKREIIKKILENI